MIKTLKSLTELQTFTFNKPRGGKNLTSQNSKEGGGTHTFPKAKDKIALVILIIVRVKIWKNYILQNRVLRNTNFQVADSAIHMDSVFVMKILSTIKCRSLIYSFQLQPSK